MPSTTVTLNNAGIPSLLNSLKAFKSNLSDASIRIYRSKVVELVSKLYGTLDLNDQIMHHCDLENLQAGLEALNELANVVETVAEKFSAEMYFFTYTVVEQIHHETSPPAGKEKAKRRALRLQLRFISAFILDQLEERSKFHPSSAQSSDLASGTALGSQNEGELSDDQPELTPDPK